MWTSGFHPHKCATTLECILCRFLVASAEAEWFIFSLWCLFACLFVCLWTDYFMQEINTKWLTRLISNIDTRCCVITKYKCDTMLASILVVSWMCVCVGGGGGGILGLLYSHSVASLLQRCGWFNFSVNELTLQIICPLDEWHKFPNELPVQQCTGASKIQRLKQSSEAFLLKYFCSK